LINSLLLRSLPVRHVLAESLPLSAIGGVMGVVLAPVGAETLVRIMLSRSPRV
jgi:hypothetical protein